MSAVCKCGAELERLLERLWELHTPTDEEVEVWLGDEGHDAMYPQCAGVVRGYRHCDGHSRTVQVCSECGYDNDGDSAYFRAWPCPTIKAAGGPGTAREGGS